MLSFYIFSSLTDMIDSYNWCNDWDELQDSLGKLVIIVYYKKIYCAGLRQNKRKNISFTQQDNHFFHRKFTFKHHKTQFLYKEFAFFFFFFPYSDDIFPIRQKYRKHLFYADFDPAYIPKHGVLNWKLMNLRIINMK